MAKKDNEKDMIFYEAALKGWFDNRMEIDKQVIYLSGAAIALLASAHENIRTPHELLFWAVSGLSFIVSIAITILVYRKNSDYIESILNDSSQDKSQRNKTLKTLSKASILSFLTGAAFMLLFYADLTNPTEFLCKY